MLPACAPFRGGPERQVSVERDLEALAPVIASERVVECLAAPDAPAIRLYPPEPQPTDIRPLVSARACRDRLVTARVYAIDLQFATFEDELFRQSREMGFGATIATLGIDAAGAVAGGGTSRILSAISGGITGSRAAFEREVLAERTILAIHTAMRANRSLVLARIREGLRRDAGAYPLGAALTDVEDYYFAGTILGALIGITQAVGVQAAEADARLAAATGLSQSDAARALRLWFDEPDLPDEERLRRLRAIQEAARAEGLGDVTVASFIRDTRPENEEKLALVARRLELAP